MARPQVEFPKLEEELPVPGRAHMEANSRSRRLICLLRSLSILMFKVRLAAW
jgi:hypothetical protein